MSIIQNLKQCWIFEKKAIGAISVLFLLILLFIFSDDIILKQRADIISRNIKLVGKVIRYIRGSRLEVECTYKGHTFVVEQRRQNSDIEIGEYFIVYYDEFDPTKSLIQLHQPVFVDSSDIVTVIGTVLNSETIGNLNRRGAEIEYPFRNKKIIRFRIIPYEWELIPGDKVFVQYKESNPNICIIKLEE